ncbi:hypothetical protein VM1G_11417 [Cytospora mali]|uniref:Uncharacterized protein n=1 Tax=Cytospora mali TaxID=578113 RepID=A0A194VPG2_CYTMA|nr:hypothetical protein VM1G_11417 [Valsa mali]
MAFHLELERGLGLAASAGTLMELPLRPGGHGIPPQHQHQQQQQPEPEPQSQQAVISAAPTAAGLPFCCQSQV